MEKINFDELDTKGRLLISEYQSFEIENVTVNTIPFLEKMIVREQNLTLKETIDEQKFAKYLLVFCTFIPFPPLRIPATILTFLATIPIIANWLNKKTDYVIIKKLIKPTKLTVEVNEESETIKHKISERARAIEDIFGKEED
jgi:hypothetical protein